MIAMTALSDGLLTAVLVYGPWALALVTLLSGIGLPMPATMILMAAGAFVQQGLLDWAAAGVLAILGAVIGDNLSYLIGRLGGAVAAPRLQTSQIWTKAVAMFKTWGALSIFLSRFLITPLALPINLLAGSTGYAIWRYATIVIIGEVLWVVMFVGGGYLFADQWEMLSSIAGDFSGLLVGVVLFMASGIYLLRNKRRNKTS